MPSHAEAVLQRQLLNELVPVASGQNRAEAIPMNADATVYLGSLEPYQMIDYQMTANRCVFVYLTHGALTINGVSCETGDQARIANESEFMLGAINNSEFVLVDGTDNGQTSPG